MECVTQFRQALEGAFGPLDWLPIPDSMIHRFRVPSDKPGTLNGWYLLFADGIASGVFGSWKVGGSHTWSSRKPSNPSEARMLAERINQARQQRANEQRQRQLAAADYANRLWRDARRADPAHPYLTRKAVRPYALRQHGDALLVPLVHDSQVVNVQRIYPDGSKRFLSGGMVSTCYSPLGLITPGQALYICEGWATGATLHAETGAAVACAMNAGNLLSVAQRLQRQHRDAVLIMAGDDDRMTEGNPGRTAAIKAAATIGCGLVMPPWSGAEPLELSDFNDLANWRAAQ